ncbi:MAG TPA: hypothetical protein VHZ55_12505 [Bryobacteraceae bacterium]|jgi:hypothetical protein|nr:hypothetical protein [Bryobacteraceae bacterium]
MNTAQHADRILSAWRTADRIALKDALLSARHSCDCLRSVSRLDNEKQEVLESVVEHLQTFERQEQFPAYSTAAGAATLLAHLCSDFSERNIYRLDLAFSTTKN